MAMGQRNYFILVFMLVTGVACAADLSKAPAEDLLKVYAQLRQLHSGDQWATTENVVWKRDAGTFTLKAGRITFAAPVEGRVLAAVFQGAGTFTLAPPTPIDQRQIARVTKGPRLQDEFKEAVFFFSDDSFVLLEKVLALRTGAEPRAELAAAQKECAENFNSWWANQTKGNFPMRNLAARMLADLTDPSSRGFFLAYFKAERAGNLVYEVSWNRDPLLLPYAGRDEEVTLLHYNPGNYYEWWAGFHLAEEYARSAHPEHRTLLAHCRQTRIQAEVGKDNRLAATAEIEFEVPGGGTRVLPFMLSGVLRISSVQDAQGNKVSFIQEARELDSDPWLILPAPAVAGRPYTVKVAYQEDSTRDSRVIHQRGSGLYYVTSRTSWFPSFGAFDDRTKFQLQFRSPKKFKFAATGRPTKAEKSGDFLDTQWEFDLPMTVVGFNYGEFVEKTQSDAQLAVTAYSGKEVPDELKNLSAGIDRAELGSGVGGVRNLDAQMGIARGGFNTASMAAQAAGTSFQALKLFAHYFGPLPFKNVAVTEQPVRGYGQSWPTLIFLPYDAFLDSTTRHSLGFQESAEAIEFYNLVAPHEMAHQWWGHLVGWKTYHDQWLSEGLAEFSAGLYLQMSDPKKWNTFWDLKRKWLLSKNTQGHRPVDVGPLWLNDQLDAYNEERNSTLLIYQKGAYVIQMLRQMMWDATEKSPDARFITMMRDFVSTFAGKNASTEDFRRVVEKHMGRPMDWFFNQWVYGTETPHYQFSYQLKEGGGGKTILLASIAQSGVSGQFTVDLPIYVTVKGQARRLGVLKPVGTTSFTVEIPLNFRPEKVTIDESRDILCTVRQ
jgi:hypothetical protein